MGEVGAIAGAVTTVVNGVDKLLQRHDASEARLEHAVDELRQPLPDPAPLKRFDLEEALLKSPVGTVLASTDVADGSSLGTGDIAEPIAQRLFSAAIRAALKNQETRGRVTLAVVVMPVAEAS